MKKTAAGLFTIAGIYTLNFYYPRNKYKFRKRAGTHRASNLVTNVGLDYIRDSAILNAVDKITEWRFLPLQASPTVSENDTYEDHAGWEEFTNYDEPERAIWAGYADLDNHGWSKNDDFEGEFTLTTEDTIGGMALAGGGSSIETKGHDSGEATLMSAAALDDGNVTYPEDFVATCRYELQISRQDD